MLDIGWSEFLVIGVVALVVIGPRELPGALRSAGRFAARARALANEFREGLDDIAREVELKDLGERIMDDGQIDSASRKQPAADRAAEPDKLAEADAHEADLDEADMADWDDEGTPEPFDIDEDDLADWDKEEAPEQRVKAEDTKDGGADGAPAPSHGLASAEAEEPAADDSALPAAKEPGP